MNNKKFLMTSNEKSIKRGSFFKIKLKFKSFLLWSKNLMQVKFSVISNFEKQKIKT